MSQGFSLRTRDLIMEADAGKIGVRLGRWCLHNDVPVSQVARAFGVSRTTIYNWFWGAAEPNGAMVARIENYIAD